MLRVCVLASGSSGNCVYVASETTALLVDAGLSGKETVRRLAAIDVALETVQGICLTHEHDDHRTALGVLHRRAGIPLYANSGTIEALEQRRAEKRVAWNVFRTGEPFGIGDLTIEPFSVPHDSYDPVGFVVGTAELRAGIVTDMGTPTELIRQRLKPCQVLVLEANHDEELLRDAERPWALKQRILGRHGHLSNEASVELIKSIVHPRTRHLVLAHASQECNRYDLVERQVGKCLAELGRDDVALAVARQDTFLPTLWV